MNLSRRELLKAASAAPFASLLSLRAAEPILTFPGMIVRQTLPQNLEMPFASLSDWVVAAERFYVRSHFAVPKIDAANFKLIVEGHVENRLELSLADLKQFEKTTTPLTLECAGNGRVFLTPAVRGLQWANGAVGNAEWNGIPLGTLLDRAKPKAGAIDVVLAGVDSGSLTADPATPGAIHFSRSLPLAKAKKPESIIAWGMNGADLTPSHGFPLRAVIGGWYGMASVKWLNRIFVSDRPYKGYFQTMDYSYYVRAIGSEPEVIPVTEIQPKAAIARPGPNETVPVNKPYTVFGAAWAGESTVAKVEVSADGGTTWMEAKLDDKPKPFCWVKWRWEWMPTARGPARLLAKCTDERGTTQPEKRNADRRAYAINHWVPVEVQVR